MLYRFGRHVLDTARIELRLDDSPVAIEPQVFALLKYLIENRDRVVTRTELNEAVWRSRPVTDGALSARIKAARRGVGDDGRSRSVIRTVHRTGYQFVADVEASAGSVLGSTRDSSAKSIDLTTPNPLGIRLSLPQTPSIVVLPFHAVSGGEDRNVVALGLTHDITTRIARLRWMFVIARGTASQFTRGTYDVREVGARLGVHYVLEGAVQISGDNIVLNVSLADTQAGEEIWADRLTHSIDSLDELQIGVVDYLAARVANEIEATERNRALLLPSRNIDAWSAYHRGCWHMYRFTRDSEREAEFYFRRSIELDPRSPRAYAGLSFVHFQRAFLGMTGDRAGEIQRAYDLAVQSIDIDPREPLGYWALGRAQLLHRNFEQSVRALETATTLNPSMASAQYSLAFALMHRGDCERSLSTVVLAQRLSPYDPLMFAMLGVQAHNLMLLGRAQEAAEIARQAAQHPNAHHHILAIAAVCHAAASRKYDAHRYMSRLHARYPNYSEREYLVAFPFERESDVRAIREVFRSLSVVTPRPPPNRSIRRVTR